jgi:hypothetical protein
MADDRRNVPAAAMTAELQGSVSDDQAAITRERHDGRREGTGVTMVGRAAPHRQEKTGPGARRSSHSRRARF